MKATRNVSPVLMAGMLGLVLAVGVVLTGYAAEGDAQPVDGTFPIPVVVIASIIHCILTFAMYKMKGGGYACFYFFLAPLALLLLLYKVLGGLGTGNYRSSNDVHHHHHYH